MLAAAKVVAQFVSWTLAALVQVAGVAPVDPVQMTPSSKAHASGQASALEQSGVSVHPSGHSAVPSVVSRRSHVFPASLAVPVQVAGAPVQVATDAVGIPQLSLH